MGKRAVVSFANGDYLSKLERLKSSLIGNTDADIVTFTKYEEVGCKSHQDIPYQFKPYSIWEAIEQGYDSILWLDSPIVATKDITPVFEYIEEHGYVFFNNYGHPLGRWANQNSLDYFGYSKELAMSVKQIMACAMGFKIDHKVFDTIQKALMEYRDLSERLYPGSWLDHRHDQTVMSFLIDKYDLNIVEGHKTFFIYEHFKQVEEFKPLADSICLISK